MSDSNLTIDDLTALPEKMRAHAAARAIGMTSKEFLAAMAGIGVEVKSAQSGVTREALLTWFAARGGAGQSGTTPEAETAAPSTSAPRKAPAKKTAGPRTAAAQPAAVTAEPAEGDTSTVDQSGAGEAARETTAPRSSRTSPAKKAAASASGGPPKREPLPSIAIVTGDVGTEESGSRRRRSTASPTFSPLFLSPDESEPTPASSRTRPSRPKAGETTIDPGPAAENDAESVEESAATESIVADDSDESTESANRRRRRGRRGRGRGRGESSDDEQTAENIDDSSDDSGDSDDSDDSGDDSDDAGDTDSAGGSSDDSGDDSEDGDSDGDEAGSSRRRRRRRRPRGGSGSDDTQGSNDEPPSTEVNEREPRRRPGRGTQGGQTSGQGGGSTPSDEVQGITGSTRLEAKRQRRRDGREAGRRRQPILSESEFLARRESVDRVMVVREKPRTDGSGVMTQVGVLEDKVLVEHFVTTESARSMVGNVFLGRVQNVLPSMEAAFVDIGRGRNGVLYAGEVNWEAAGLGGKARRIEQALKPGDMVLVQVTKDPIGQKGARLTTQISLAGRFLVYVPDGNSTGISRKLPDTERRRLKAILKDVVPEGSGVIIRTAAEGVSEEEIGRDVARLSAQWTEIAEAAQKRTSSGAATPVALYEEPDLLVKVVRDLFNEDFSTLVIQGDTSWDTVRDYVSRVAPEMTDRLARYETPDVDVFATYRVDEQLAKALDRKVWLPSGGSLVIDRTEAMTVVDVNTGKYTGSGGNLEETVTKNNLEAAEEIVRQLRLRDVGGMVIVDFIDMVLESNRDLVLRRLTEALGRDRTRHQVSEVTSLGLVQLTRKKLGTGLVEAFSTPCEHCQGRGLLVHADPVHTESHNADDPGARRGRRKNGKGSGQQETQQAPAQKDGPAPTAHPAALALRQRDDGNDDTDGGVDGPSTDAPSTDAPSTDAPSDNVVGQPALTQVTTEGADSAEDTGSRSRRRRRSTRRPAGDTATAATEDVSAGPTDAAPADNEAAVVAEAAHAVKVVETEAPSPAEQPAASESAPGQGHEPAAASGPASHPTPVSEASPTGRRPRRRSTRREAGAAGPGAIPTEESAPVAVVPVEAAPLAETPPAVVAEPRKRPARRRATRSTSTPGDDG